MEGRFFYHSFPRTARPADAGAAGLAVLGSLASHGLLLTPERTEWFEFRQDGTRSEVIEVFQKRACFTELAPRELEEHAKQFGPFAIEFETESLRLLGAIPVFYLPTPGSEERALGGLAAALVGRMAEIQMLLSRLADIAHLSSITPNKNEPLAVTLNGRAAGATRCTIGGAEDLIQVVSHGAQPVQELLNAFRFISGFFYPTENLGYTGALAYYRQREWRILGGMKHRGQEVARALTEAEVEALLALDRAWFERRLTFPTGEYRRVDQCQYLSEVGGRSFLAWAHRLIVPAEHVQDARELLRQAGVPVPVISGEDLAGQQTT